MLSAILTYAMLGLSSLHSDPRNETQKETPRLCQAGDYVFFERDPGSVAEAALLKPIKGTLRSSLKIKSKNGCKFDVNAYRISMSPHVLINTRYVAKVDFEGAGHLVMLSEFTPSDYKAFGTRLDLRIGSASPQLLYSDTLNKRYCHKGFVLRGHSLAALKVKVLSSNLKDGTKECMSFFSVKSGFMGRGYELSYGYRLGNSSSLLIAATGDL